VSAPAAAADRGQRPAHPPPPVGRWRPADPRSGVDVGDGVVAGGSTLSSSFGPVRQDLRC